MVYCRQVPGFEKSGHEKHVLLLKKALYGTKQAANAWQKFLAEILLSIGGRKHPKDESVYLFREGEGFLFLGTHVDDLFPLFNKQGELIRDKILDALKQRMTIDNKGELRFALDTKIERDRERGILKISQQAYTENLLKEYNMHESNSRETPAMLSELTESDLPKTESEKKEADAYPVRNLIGRLWWLVLISRPDLNCAVHKCATWQNKPSSKLWKSLMCILKYLQRTKHFGLIYRRQKIDNTDPDLFLLKAYSDSSFATENSSKSRFGYFYFVLGCLVSWTSQHSTRVMSSSTEAECHTLVHCGKENIFIREFLSILKYFACISPLTR